MKKFKFRLQVVLDIRENELEQRRMEAAKIITVLKTQEAELQEIINSLTKIDELLDSALLINIDNSATNYTLKNSIACVVENEYNLYNLL